jgi:hypothetical protein
MIISVPAFHIVLRSSRAETDEWNSVTAEMIPQFRPDAWNKITFTDLGAALQEHPARIRQDVS